jgi:hypothetical protein
MNPCEKRAEPFSLSNFYIIDFSSGVLPVESKMEATC